MRAASPSRPRRWGAVALFAIVFLAFCLRVTNLGVQDLWGDESASASLALQPLSDILRVLAQGEPHPPLYPLLLWLWVKLAGAGEFALRFPSLVLGVLVVALVAQLGRRMQGLSLAILAALVLTVSPFMIWFSQETRMYMLVATASAAAAVALYRGLGGCGKAWVGFFLAATVMIYAHYYGLLVLTGFTLLAAAGLARGRLSFRPWLLAYGLIALSYLPWVLYASRIFFSYYGVAPGRVDLNEVFAGFWLRATFGNAIEPAEGVRWLPVFLALMLIGVFAAVRGRAAPKGGPDRRWRVGLLLAWLAAPLVGGYIVSLVRPMYAERYLIVSAVPFLILVAWGLSALRRPRVAQVMAILIVLFAFSLPLRNQYFDPRYIKSEYSRHTAEVQGLAGERDGIILDGSSQTPLLDYYYKGPLPHYPVPDKLPLDETETAARLQELTARHTGLWVFLYATHDYDPGDFVEQWLSTNAYRAWHTWTVNGRLVYYGTYPREKMSVRPGTARFGDQVALEGWATRTEPYAAGEVVPLLFNWKALAAPGRDLKLSLRLQDAEGFIWGQSDVEPASGFRPTRTWRQDDVVEDHVGVLITPGTPPGRYKLELRVYPDGAVALPASSPSLAVSGTMVTLGEVVVGRPGRQVAGVAIPAYRSIGASFGGQVALEGESGVGEVTAGQTAYLTVLWRALAKPAGDLVARFRLVDGQGQVAAQIVARPANGEFGPARWESGDVLRGQFNLRLPAKTPPGEYSLRLSLETPSGSPLAVAGARGAVSGNTVTLQRLVVKPRPAPATSSRPEVEVGAVLGGEIVFRGYSIRPDTAAPGGKLSLTLYWEALAELETPYTVFTHLLDAEERIWGQQDAQPCGGGCPTPSWLPGDVIEDRYEIPVKSNAAPGEYSIEIGMYDAKTGKRLAVADDAGKALGDRVVLPKVGVGDR